MVNLKKIIDACNMAIEETDDELTNSFPFFELADPKAVLELARLVEAGTGRIELERILALIRDMSDYLLAIPSDFDMAVAGGKRELVSKALCILAIYDFT